MASVAEVERPSIVVTVVTLGVFGLIGLLAFRWLTSLVAAIIQLGLIIVAIYLIARVGLYLLRKGGTA